MGFENWIDVEAATKYRIGHPREQGRFLGIVGDVIRVASARPSEANWEVAPVHK